jgi:hypothetical protein
LRLAAAWSCSIRSCASAAVFLPCAKRATTATGITAFQALSPDSFAARRVSFAAAISALIVRQSRLAAGAGAGAIWGEVAQPDMIVAMAMDSDTGNSA